MSSAVPSRSGHQPPGNRKWPNAIGVLIMYYGTPASPGELEAFYTDIRGGRRPSPEQLAELRRRYDAIGGISGLADRAAAQAEGLQRQLDERRSASGAQTHFTVFLGAKHAVPVPCDRPGHPGPGLCIEDAVAQMSATGITSAVGVVLAPHFSSMSVGEYLERARRASERLAKPISFKNVGSWHLEPAIVELWAERLRNALGRLPTGLRTEVIFTAHSLPARIIEEADPYPSQIAETAQAVARGAGVASWRVAWQSAGKTPEMWMGPDINEVINDLPGEATQAVVVCPVGFTADHLEILYDLDIEARRAAEERRLHFGRTESLNDDARFLGALADVVIRAAKNLTSRGAA